MSKEKPEIKAGDPIVFVDEQRIDRPALVKHVWPGMSGQRDGCNLVFVSADEARTDSAGRQTEIRTSVPHIWSQPAGGYAWKYPGE